MYVQDRYVTFDVTAEMADYIEVQGQAEPGMDEADALKSNLMTGSPFTLGIGEGSIVLTLTTAQAALLIRDLAEHLADALQEEN